MESSPQSLSQSVSQNMYAVLSEDDDDVNEIMEEYGEEEGNLTSVYTSHILQLLIPLQGRRREGRFVGRRRREGRFVGRRRREGWLIEETGERIHLKRVTQKRSLPPTLNKDCVSPQHDN